MRGPNGLGNSAWPWIALYSTALITLAYNCAIGKFLAIDGSCLFNVVLDRHQFTTWDWWRAFSEYITQWPLYLGVRLGLRDLDQLEALYALGLAFPYLLSFGLSLVAVRGQAKWPLLFPLVSYLTVNLPADYAMIAEGNVATLLAWPTLLFALRRERYTNWDLVMVVALLVVQMRTYASVFLTGAIFAYVFFGRRTESRTAKTLLVGLCAMLVGLGAGAIAFPFYAPNRASFFLALTAPLSNWQFLGGMSFAVPLMLGLWRGYRPFVAIGTVLALIWPFLHTPPTLEISLFCRTLCMTWLPLLLAIAVYLIRRPTTFEPAYFAPLAVFVAVAVSVSLLGSRQWVDFRAQMTQVLKTRAGFVPLEQTPLAAHPCHFNWTYPLLSYIWSEGQVRCIILNAKDNGWEPFNPRTTAILHDYFERPPFLETP